MIIEARIIHKERSLYSTILVDQRGSTLCLQFSVRKDQRNQTCLDKNAPRKMVFPYAKMMMMSLLMVPEPERVLIVGLGGGTLPVALNELYPNAVVDSVEIDPAVKTVAETYFGFKENEQMKVILMLHEGVPVSIQLPQRVTVEIVEADPVVKGQTASSSYKPAVADNGMRVMVPPHIAAGTRVVIMTEDGSYVERAKD